MKSNEIVTSIYSKSSKTSRFGTSSSTKISTSLSKSKKSSKWWPFKLNPSACSSSSAKGIGSGSMKKEDINL